MAYLSRTQCDEAPTGYSGYSSIRLRPQTARKFEELKRLVNETGGLLLSAGGTREVNAEVTSGRSLISMHYLGRAFDLPPYAGAFRPKKDPYVVTEGQEVLVRVTAADAGGECVPAAELKSLKEFQAYFKKHKAVPMGIAEGAFVSFTDLAKRAGFVPIPPRSGWGDGEYASWEWWHWEDREGLEEGRKFLEELEAAQGAKAVGALRKEHRDLLKGHWWSEGRNYWVRA